MSSKSKKVQPKSSTPVLDDVLVSNTTNVNFWENQQLHQLILFIAAILLYANTLIADYTIDDAIVITDNMFTTQGISGIPGILKYDTFYGFFKEAGKANLVAGGRYRPFTLIMFAIEYQLFGNTPGFSHLINILLFGLTGVLLYRVVLQWLGKTDAIRAGFIAFFTALLFVAHPIHTEAVANIKGRDEIVALLCSFGALYFLWQALETSDFKKSFWAGLIFLCGLLSKENTITFVAIIPLAFYVFSKFSISSVLKNMLPVFGATVLFLIIRTAVIGTQTGEPPVELMNNPFLKLQNGQYIPFSMNEKMATIFYTLYKYIVLLIFPHPLTHDYYPRHIDIQSFGNPTVLFSVVLYIALAVWAVVGVLRKKITGFAAAYYLVTLSIVSNIVFPIGTNMSERFVYMPSFAFCLVIGLLLWYLYKKIGTLTIALPALMLFLFGYKTITRNLVWKDNFTLFMTDIHVSPNSAKLCNAVGGDLIRVYSAEKDPAVKKAKLEEAIRSLKKAVEIHPIYKNAYLLMGNAYFYLSDLQNAIKSYEQALVLDPNYADAKKNLAISYRDMGRKAGEQENNVAKALEYLTKAYSINKDDIETVRLLGVANGMSGKFADAALYFKRQTELDPKNARAWFDLGNSLLYSGNKTEGEAMIAKAKQMDPKVGG